MMAHPNFVTLHALLQAEEAEHLRKDRDDKRASLGALQEEVQMHREQVRALRLPLSLSLCHLWTTNSNSHA